MDKLKIITTGNGKPALRYEDGIFRQRRINKKSIRWDCTNKKCPAHLITNVEMDQLLQCNPGHNHETSQRAVDLHVFRQRCKLKAADEISTRPMEIMITEAHSSDVLYSDLATVRRAIYRKRTRNPRSETEDEPFEALAETKDMATSFQKKARIKVGQIQGTRPSLYNNQLLISTGIPSLDNVIGGGVAVGTVILIEEDVFGSYSRLMLKYFVAEGILSNQTIFLSSANESPHGLIQELPAPIEYDPVSRKNSAKALVKSKPPGTESSLKNPTAEGSEEKMKIAWRYQNQPKLQSTVTSTSQFGHYYDLTKVMNQDTLEKANIYTDSPNVFTNSELRPMVDGMNVNYVKLFQEIQYRIENGKFGTAQQLDKRSILRIGIHSLGSPLWGENAATTDTGAVDSSLTLFLIALRAALRSALAVAMVTVPTHLFHDTAFVHRIRKMSDTVIRLESFAGSEKEKNPVFKDYHGLLHLLQLPRINSLIPPQPETSDLAFKLRRKKLTIERLHLPPELADTTGRSSQQEDNPLFSHKAKARGSCSTTESRLSF